MYTNKLIKAISHPSYALQLLLHFFSPLIKNDELYVKLNYKLVKGKPLDLNNPITFNEKMQWLKIHYHRNEFTSMVDKYEAKLYVSNIIGIEHIIPTLGIYKSFDEIDFDKLPEQFVLKCTHNSGGTVICRNKQSFNKERAKNILNKCLKKNIYWATREFPYKNVPPRIIAETFMNDGRADVSGLTDYKFFCFNGKVNFLYVSQGLENHETAEISFFYLDGKRMPFKRLDFKPIKEFIIPNKFDDMKIMAADIAKKLDLPFIRVDLYEVNGHIYFSELTFFPCSGLIPFDPEEWDYKIGEWLRLPNEKDSNSH